MLNDIKCVGGPLDGSSVEMRGLYATVKDDGFLKYWFEYNCSNTLEDKYVLQAVNICEAQISLYVWKGDVALINTYVNNLMNPSF